VVQNYTSAPPELACSKTGYATRFQTCFEASGGGARRNEAIAASKTYSGAGSARFFIFLHEISPNFTEFHPDINCKSLPDNDLNQSWQKTARAENFSLGFKRYFGNRSGISSDSHQWKVTSDSFGHWAIGSLFGHWRIGHCLFLTQFGSPLHAGIWLLAFGHSSASP
jgi:hypothetical protein